jgi:hypothetical protein
MTLFGMTGLVAASVACGLLAAWVFQRAVDMAALRLTLRQIHARLLEFRLFFDEPRLIWRAQKALVGANLRVCALLLWPALILALPMAWLMMQLDAAYGTAALHVGEPAVVTAQLAADSQLWVLEAPPGIAVETPAMHVLSERQMVWRIRPLRPVAGLLRFRLRGVTLTKAIAAGSPSAFLLRRRERSLLPFLMHPEEPRLPAGSVVWLEVDYPEASRWWMVWFLAISTVSAFLFAQSRTCATT